MFTDLFGNAPHARVLDYLADRSDFDHTISEISRGADVARPTTYKVVADLTEQGVVVETRLVGNSRFFALDLDNETVRRLLAARVPVLGGLGDSDAPSGPRRRPSASATGSGRTP